MQSTSRHLLSGHDVGRQLHGSGHRATGAWLSLSLLVLGAALGGLSAGCGEDGKAIVGSASTSRLRARRVSWESNAPTFSARFAITDERGRPVEGVKVAAAGLSTRTDEKGAATLEGLVATGRTLVRVEHPEYMATLMRSSHDTSGVRQQRVTVVKLGPPRSVATDLPVTLRDGDAQWEFPSSPFVNRKGEPAEGEAQVQMLSFPIESLPRSAVPGDDAVVTKEGTRSAATDLISLIFTEVRDENQAPVKFATGVTAKLTTRLPASVRERPEVPKQLDLLSLDVEKGLWTRESECEVSEVKGSNDLVCTGTVDHFSYWMVADIADDYGPDSYGCVNMYVDPSALGSSLDAVNGEAPWLANLPLLRCEDGACAQDDLFLLGQRATLAPNETRSAPASCGIAEADQSYRFEAGLFRPGIGTFLIQQDFTLAPLGDVEGAEELLTGGFDPETDCATRCQQVVVTPTPSDLVGLIDADDDGFYVVDDSGDPAALAETDCDDSDPTRYPGALEPWCDSVDRDCDGTTAADDVTYPPGGAIASYEACTGSVGEVTDDLPLCPYVWNRNCDLACFETGESRPGDPYDDDCDGVVVDADGDGYDLLGTLQDLPDCDDADGSAFPGAMEVPGNPVDEDCDGAVLDADGDGYYAYGHELAATRAGLTDNADLALMFSDCNDWDPTVNVDAPPESEAGQLQALYATEDELTRRLDLFCSYFDDEGAPTALFRRGVIDRNCDGNVTDVDGDGLTALGDTTLGDSVAVDCDDFDPRVGEVAGADGAPDCSALERDRFNNESACMPALDQLGSTGPALACPLVASRFATQCLEVSDEVSLCLYPGWDTRDPVRFTPGTLWGPCDGPQRLLPDCPTGSVCGAPATYSDALVSYLETTYADGEALEFQGMCFRTCDPDLATPAP